jgi:hypothetical protein
LSWLLRAAVAASSHSARAAQPRLPNHLLQAGVWSLDFLPLNPTSPSTALLLLSAGRAPGEVRIRQLKVQGVRADDTTR